MARIKKPQFNVWVRPDGKIPAAAYLRVSSNGQDVENSIDAQLERIRKWGRGTRVRHSQGIHGPGKNRKVRQPAGLPGR